MTHLLDTDVIISHLYKKVSLVYPPNTKLTMSVITLGELLYGANKAPHSAIVSDQITQTRTKLSITLLPVTETIITLFAQLKVNLERSGQKLADFDLLIAATALAHDLILVTSNKKHFKRIPGLKLM